jgi:hypothetical protein
MRCQWLDFTKRRKFRLDIVSGAGHVMAAQISNSEDFASFEMQDKPPLCCFHLFVKGGLYDDLKKFYVMINYAT